MSVTSVNEVRLLVPAAKVLSDTDLQAVINRVEAEIAAIIGGPYAEDKDITLTLPGGGKYLPLPRRINQVVSVTVYATPADDGRALDDAEYMVWPQEGLLERAGGRWEPRVVVVFQPVDDREQWKQAVIDLVRLDIERTAQKQESVGGEYSYTAPDWERERRKILRRLRFVAAG